LEHVANGMSEDGAGNEKEDGRMVNRNSAGGLAEDQKTGKDG
jgi:hypothetical protein